MDIKFDFDDILLTPEIITTIDSRGDVNPFLDNGFLPIFTAPMDSVVDGTNYIKFINEKINVVLPRGNYVSTELSNDIIFKSYGLDEFIDLYLTIPVDYLDKQYVLIDIANGHMSKLFKAVSDAKAKHGDSLIIMVGNIANPKTFLHLSSFGADYIRCGIGGGQGCLTSVQTGVGYPMGSLIQEIYDLKVKHNLTAKIVADGGFKSYSDIIKALALGADYVMLGSMLNKTLESCGDTFIKVNNGYFTYDNYLKMVERGLIVGNSNNTIETLLAEGILYKRFRGMSTKEVQSAWGKIKLTTSEGISKYNKVEYTLNGFVNNLEDYLRSAMSYTNSKNLDAFKGSKFSLISPAAHSRFKK
jgi:GMP reductase